MEVRFWAIFKRFYHCYGNLLLVHQFLGIYVILYHQWEVLIILIGQHIASRSLLANSNLRILVWKRFRYSRVYDSIYLSVNTQLSCEQVIHWGFRAKKKQVDAASRERLGKKKARPARFAGLFFALARSLRSLNVFLMALTGASSQANK